MKKIIISPWSKKMRSGVGPNPKNYPYWLELVKLLKAKGYRVIQIGVVGEEEIGADEIKCGLSLKKLAEMVIRCDTWITVDNFFPHLCWLVGKKGFAIFGQSDPNIFGHSSNVNILKNRSYLRAKQFDIWESAVYEEDAFLSAKEVMKIIEGV